MTIIYNKFITNWSKENLSWRYCRESAELFGVDLRTANDHLKNIYAEGELVEEVTIRKKPDSSKRGKKRRQTRYLFYNLDAIISVGYRVNLLRATQFRQWATGVLRTFAIRGYVLDKEKLKNGTFLNEEYFDHLLEEIREMRASEKNSIRSAVAAGLERITFIGINNSILT